MNARKSTWRKYLVLSTARQAVAMLAALTLMTNSLFGGAMGAPQTNRKSEVSEASRLREEQRIAHVLNRLGFGVRPGDVERVRAMGIERYIEQQLHPASIKDEVAEAKLRDLPTLAMDSGELLARYPNPGLLVRQLQRRGDLPAELAAAVAARKNGDLAQLKGQNKSLNKDSQAGNASVMPGEGAPDAMMNEPLADEAMPKKGTGAEARPSATDGDTEAARNQYRRSILAYMREHSLQPPQRITAELQASRILRAVYSERQLQEVMVDFWTNHFNVFAGKGADRWLLTAYDRDVIRPHALGKFRDLLGATAQSPAMLFYLDNFQSVSPNARPGRSQPGKVGRRDLRVGAMRRQLPNGEQRRTRQGDQPLDQREDAAMAPPQRLTQMPKRLRRGLNENYARELMELHTLGVDGGYTQKDVQEVARAFTGWTISDPRGYQNTEDTGKFVFNARVHDDDEKIVLGQKIPPGGGRQDGEIVLDILARHPSTAKFIATKLARRFVMDQPTPALVERLAKAFTKHDGDIRETLRAVITSPEFNAAEARRAKIKTPFELVISAIRTLGGETNGAPQLHQWIARMGEPLYMYQAPTGYPDTAEHWVNTGALLERLNFTLALVSNRIPGTRVNLARFIGDEALSNREINQGQAIDLFARLILQGEMSPKTKEVLTKQLASQSTASVASDSMTATKLNAMNQAALKRDEGHLDRTRRARRGQTPVASGDLATGRHPEISRIAALILGSPDFQRQ